MVARPDAPSTAGSGCTDPEGECCQVTPWLTGEEEEESEGERSYVFG